MNCARVDRIDSPYPSEGEQEELGIRGKCYSTAWTVRPRAYALSSKVSDHYQVRSASILRTVTVI